MKTVTHGTQLSPTAHRSVSACGGDIFRTSKGDCFRERCLRTEIYFNITLLVPAAVFSRPPASPFETRISRPLPSSLLAQQSVST